MAITAQQIITAALRKLAVYDASQAIQSVHLNYGYDQLNQLFEQLNADGTILPYEKFQQFGFPQGDVKDSYTIGPASGENSPDFEDARPLRILSANLATAEDVYRLLVLESADEYAAFPRTKAVTNLPMAVWYQTTAPNGTIWPIPAFSTAPSATTKLELYYWAQLEKFADLETPVSFPPGFEAALIGMLARKMAPTLGRVISPDLDAEFNKAEMAVINSLLTPSRIPKTTQAAMAMQQEQQK